MASNVSDLISRAAQAHANNRFNECEQLCKTALAGEPDNVQALLLLGVVHAKKGEFPTSVPLLERVVRGDPTSFQAHLWLSMVQRRLGDYASALQWAREAEALNPKDPQGLNQLGRCYLDAFQFEAAEPCFRKAIAITPSAPMTYYGLGLALQGLGRSQEAISAFRHASSLDPNSVSTQTALREALMDEGDAEGAVQCARAVLRQQPASAEANLWLARALIENNQGLEAEEPLGRALKSGASDARTQALLGVTLQAKGRIREAEEHFRRAIQLSPDQAAAYLSLATNRKMGKDDLPLAESMAAQLKRADLSPYQASQFHFALGKCNEDFGDYENAMKEFDEANRLSYLLKFGDRPLDRPRLERSLDFILQTFTREFLRRHRGIGSVDKAPILIIGMMRSGTTLTEQILSSHPEVGAAGEQRFWSDNRNAAFDENGRLDEKVLKRLGEEYSRVLRHVAHGKARIVDKMPLNYQMLGLIHLAFPHAKFIHARRNPIDTCISIYTTPNRARVLWAHNKSNIEFAYRQYLRLMDHWRQVLPPGVMIESNYEDLVSDREASTRSLLDFCGLEWNNLCLHPEENERSVVTPSVWQVRQPVYKTSMERWRKYEPWLGAFANLAEPGS